MSNTKAIAAATATLRAVLLTKMQELDDTLGDLEVTVQPPDLARKGVSKPQLNIFLYHTALNSGWRNMDLPGQSKPGERGTPPLPLNLYFMITAYARDDNDNLDLSGHRVLAGAMSVLHDYPLLKKADIDSALPNSELALQIERVRISPQPLSVDEIYKLWTVYQSPYRISAAYELTVALIDSTLGQKAGLPVLTRGAADQGVFAVASPAPSLTAVIMPKGHPAARLGDEIIVIGEHVSAGGILRFTGANGATEVDLVARAGAEPGQLLVRLPAKGPAPDDPLAFQHWAPGRHALSLISDLPGIPPLPTLPIEFALEPVITVSPLNATAGDFVLALTCAPQLRKGQSVQVLFGEQALVPDPIVPEPDPAKPSKLTCHLKGVAAGTYLVRLRVDRVDSMPIVYAGAPAVPAFDPAFQVKVAP
jgi:hypothetical protein